MSVAFIQGRWLRHRLAALRHMSSMPCAAATAPGRASASAARKAIGSPDALRSPSFFLCASRFLGIYSWPAS